MDNIVDLYVEKEKKRKEKWSVERDEAAKEFVKLLRLADKALERARYLEQKYDL